jgi:Spy/CpxP family protein refolding chaperone
MKFNRLLFIAALGASTLGATFASQPVYAEGGKGTAKGTFEGRRGGRRDGGRMMERMAKELNLSAGQKTKIQAIMKESRERGRKIRENKSLSEDQKRAKMRENREATRKRMDAVLTATQKKKLAVMRTQMQQRMRDHRGKNGNNPRGGQRKPI